MLHQSKAQLPAGEANGPGNGDRQRRTSARLAAVDDPNGPGAALKPAAGSQQQASSQSSPRFDQHAFHVLKIAAENEGLLVGPSSLSRISRNSQKLLRVLEFLLAHHARILTTNYLLTDKEVWVRRHDLVKPDSEHPMKGIEVMHGLSGAHRKTVEAWVQRVGNPQESAL